MPDDQPATIPGIDLLPAAPLIQTTAVEGGLEARSLRWAGRFAEVLLVVTTAQRLTEAAVAGSARVSIQVQRGEWSQDFESVESARNGVSSWDVQPVERIAAEVQGGSSALTTTAEWTSEGVILRVTGDNASEVERVFGETEYELSRGGRRGPERIHLLIVALLTGLIVYMALFALMIPVGALTTEVGLVFTAPLWVVLLLVTLVMVTGGYRWARNRSTTHLFPPFELLTESGVTRYQRVVASLIATVAIIGSVGSIVAVISLAWQ